MKFKKIFASLLLAPSIILTGCATTTNNGLDFEILHRFKTLGDYVANQPSENLEWISKRTLSLRFSLLDEKMQKHVLKFGTGWILNKVNDLENDYKYYVATNIHVANSLNKLNETTERYEEVSEGKIEKIGSQKLLGFAFNFSKPNANTLLKDDNGNLIILEDNTYINLQLNNRENQKNVKISYTATNNNIIDNTIGTNPINAFVDPYTNNIVQNPAIDFAILEIDFKDVLEKKNLQGYTVRNFFDEYQKYPTKFASTKDFDFSDSYYIGGYVQNNEIIKKQTRPTWIGLNNISFNYTNLYQGVVYYDKFSEQKFENDNVKKQIKPMNGIDFVTNENNEFTYWYKNVASQILIEGGNVGGGSSGSLVCNSKNEVVGIYWGTYSFVSKEGFDYSYGAIDLFNAEEYVFQKESSGYVVDYMFPQYNIVDKLKELKYISN